MNGPISGLTFDSDAVDYAYWGAIVPLGALSGNPACEKGGCALFREFRNGFCTGADRAGLAVRLALPRGVLNVRYRVLVGEALPSSGQPPSYAPPPFQVDVAQPGMEPVTTSVMLSPSDYSPMPVPEPNLKWQTAWRTLTISAGPAPDAGVTLYISPMAECGGAGGGGPVPPPVPTVVYVDSITGG